jgi:hypothetical protein
MPVMGKHWILQDLAREIVHGGKMATKKKAKKKKKH